MFLFRGVRNRISSAVAAGIAAVFMLICGAIMAFVISPQQALEWRRVQSLPELDAAAFAATASGEAVAITGTLEGNEPAGENDLVAFYRDNWNVETPDPAEDEATEPSGTWVRTETVVPPLNIAVSGGTVTTLSASSPNFGGNLHESRVLGEGPETANDGDEELPEGTVRTRGFKNGDLITVVGDKGSSGDLAPKRLYGGDRVQLVENIRAGARAAFVAGIAMMICAPIVLVFGVLAGLFGRRR